MHVLLKSVTLLHSPSSLHQQRVDIILQEGIIRHLQPSTNSLPEGPYEHTIKGDNLYVSAGWFDMQAQFGDPGMEYREDLYTGMQAAAAGGFTDVALLPNTLPVVQTKNEVHYLRGAFQSPVSLHPIAAVTRDTQGLELTEMIDLHHAGAVAFSDGDHALSHSQVMLKALQYVQKFDGLLINRPEEPELTQFGTMHEGLQSTLLGLKGMPVLSETIALERDLRLLAYASEFAYQHTPRLHISNISAAASVDLIRQAKASRLPVTCDVAAHQLVFDDTQLASFDTNYKVNPPLRSPEDQRALLAGLQDGTIDVIVSAHQPWDEENKKCEFDQAAFGMMGLQTFLPILSRCVSDTLTWEILIEKITTQPRQLLQQAQPLLEEGAPAHLTLFNPQRTWTLNAETNLSKSINHPWWGQTLVGQVLGVFHQGKHYLAPGV